MSIRELFNELRDNKTNSLVKSLYQLPKKEKGIEMPKTQVFQPNTFHEADLLFMPEDNGYKYILMVADAHNKKIDAEPIHNKETKTVKAAFKKIYAREPLDLPHIIQMDSGHEFKGDVKEYFKDNKVDVKYTKVGRHRQMAIVERANQKVGTLLFKRMTAQELQTHEPSREWVDDLPEAVEVLNENLPVPKTEPEFDSPLSNRYNRELIPIGTKVRVMLDNPVDVGTDKRLAGKFRSTDIRWDRRERYVRQISIRPGFPPMYMLDGNGPNGLELVAYTKNQIQVIPKDEKAPSDKYLRTVKEKPIDENRNKQPRERRAREVTQNEEIEEPERDVVQRDNGGRYGLRQRATKIRFE